MVGADRSRLTNDVDLVGGDHGQPAIVILRGAADREVEAIVVRRAKVCALVTAVAMPGVVSVSIIEDLKASDSKGSLSECIEPTIGGVGT